MGPQEAGVNRILPSLSVLALATPAPAFAADATCVYPRLSDDSSDLHVEYEPNDRSEVVGGRIIVFTGTNDQRPVVAYGRPAQCSTTARGTPVFVGEDDGRPVVAYGPADQGASIMAGAAITAPGG